MPKFYVEIAQLVRQVRSIVVEAPSKEILEKREVLSEVYETFEDDGENWEIDQDFGVEEGTHRVVRAVHNDPPHTSENDEPDVDVVVDDELNVRLGRDK